MLIGMIGDTHGNRVATMETLRLGVEFGVDLFVQVGDNFFYPRMVETPFYDEDGVRAGFRRTYVDNQWAFGDEITEVLEELDRDMWFIDGNHENHFVLNRIPVDPQTGRRQLTKRIAHLPRGYRHDFGAGEWLFVGGAASVDRTHRENGVDWFDTEYITDEDVRKAVNGGPARVLVTHEAPNTPTILQRDSMHKVFNGDDDWPEIDYQRATEGRNRVDQILIGTGAENAYHGHWHHYYRDRYVLNGVERVVVGLDKDGAPPSRFMVIVDESGQ